MKTPTAEDITTCLNDWVKNIFVSDYDLHDFTNHDEEAKIKISDVDDLKKDLIALVAPAKKQKDNLRFVEVMPDKPRKTKIYSVHTTHVTAGGFGTHHNNVLSHIGEIRWHGGWRQYVNYPDPDTCWSWDCLLEVGAFIKKLMDDRK
jgi:hypothetical protein